MGAQGSEGHRRRPTARSRPTPTSPSRPGRSRRPSAAISGEARARVDASAAVDRDVRCRTRTAPFRPAGSTPRRARSRSTTLDGQKVLQKAPDETIFKRIRAFVGPVDLSNYTVEADVRATTKRRQMSDIGHHRPALLARALRQRAAAQDRAVGARDGALDHRAVRVEGRHLVSPEAARREHA